MRNPLVSVLIQNFNYGRYLRQAIDSALQQTYGNIEVVVVDDGSTDQSHAIIARYGDRIIPVLKANGGQPSAFNAGFEASHGEIICLLDSDDWFLPDKVDKIAEAFASDTEVQWIFHPLYNSLPNGTAEIIPKPRTELTNRRVDERKAVTRGRIYSYYLTPPTTGLSFSRVILERIFPIPNAAAADPYLIYAAMSLAPGMHLNHALAIRRVHGANMSMRSEWRLLWAQSYLATARQLRSRFPHTSRLSNKICSGAMAGYFRSWQRDSQFETAIMAYLRDSGPTSIVEILLRALYLSLPLFRSRRRRRV